MKNRARQLLGNHFQATKNYIQPNKYKGSVDKSSLLKSNSMRENSRGTPHGLDKKVVHNFKNKNVQIQEDEQPIFCHRPPREKSSKYKGRQTFDKSNPRSKSYRGDSEN